MSRHSGRQFLLFFLLFIFSWRTECKSFSRSWPLRRPPPASATGEQNTSLNPHLHCQSPHPSWHGTASLFFLAALQQPINNRPHSKKRGGGQEGRGGKRSELSGGVSCVSVKVTEQTAKVCQRLSIPLAALPADRRPRFIRAPRKWRDGSEEEKITAPSLGQGKVVITVMKI